MSAPSVAFVRKKLAKHDADLLLPMPLSSGFTVLVPQLLTSQGLLSLPVTASNSRAPPTQQSERGAKRFAAKRTSA